MKNRAIPLAAALIMAAVTAPAQVFQTTSGNGPTLNSNSANPFGASTAPNADPDWIFKCSTPPYLPCTPAELTRRDAVRNNQFCPTVPPTAKCTEFIMRNGDSNPMGNFAAQTPPDGFKWTNPNCTRIPCQITPTSTTKPPTRPRSGTGDESPAPNRQTPPPASNYYDDTLQPYDSEASFRAAVAAQEAATPGKVIDLGNRQYAVDLGNGQYAVGGMMNNQPVSDPPTAAANIPGLQKALEKKAAEDKLAADTKAANDNMFTGTSAGGDQNRTATPPGGGRDDGAAVEDVQRRVGGGGGSGGPTVASSGGSGSDGGGGGSGSGGGSSGSGGDGKETIKVAGSSIKLGEIETTFVRNQNMEKIINGAAKNYKAGGMTNFAGTDGQVGGAVSGRMAEPPVDPNFVGKQQWAAQSDAKK